MDCVDCPYGDQEPCPAMEMKNKRRGCGIKRGRIPKDVHQYGERTKELDFSKPSFNRVVEYQDFVYGDDLTEKE